MALLEDPAPRLPQTPGERATSIAFGLAFLLLIGMGVAQNAGDAAVAVLALVLSWLPLLVIHEAGHALAARLVGWRVAEVSLGFGRELLRFRLWSLVVRVKPLPVEGYVLPVPARSSATRREAAIVYAGGPGAEILVLCCLWLASGGELATRTSSTAVLAMQGVSIAIVMSLIFNLVPWPWARQVNDGLGIVLSLSRTEDSARDARIRVALLQSRRLLFVEDVEGAAALLDEALGLDPAATRLLAWRAACEASAGRVEAAEEALDSLASSSAGPADEAAELDAARAWTALARDGGDVGWHAVLAARRAAEASADAHHLLILARALEAAGRDEAAFSTFLDVLREPLEAEEEAQCLAHLAILARRLAEASSDARPAPSLAASPERFARSLSSANVGPRLLARVEREALAAPAAHTA